MKKLLLVSANRHRVPYSVYPLGVSYLRGYLERRLEGFEIAVFDCNMGGDAELTETVNRMKPDYVGVSLRNVDDINSLGSTSFIPGYAEIVRSIRRGADCTVIIGGAGFSIYPKAMFDALMPDYGVTGEGEESLRRLIETLEAGGDPSVLEGVACYRGGEFVCNRHSRYLPSLEISTDGILTDYYWREGGMLNIQTKRGCPYECIYCSYPLIDGRRVRTLDPDAVVEQIARLKRETGADYFFFTDSVFNIRDDYNTRLASKMIENRLGIKWGAYFAPFGLTDEMMALYAASGLTHIEFGTESFCDSQMAAYGKRFSFDDVLESSELCLKHNVYYAHFLILGGYGETDETLRQTMENSRRIRYSVFFPYFGMRVYPGTKLHRIALAEGRLSPGDDLLTPAFYLADGFDVEAAKEMARATGKAWVFPDDPVDETMDVIRRKKNKKGVLWEYLRKP